MAQLEEAALLRQLNCAPVDATAPIDRAAPCEHSNGHVSTTELQLRLTDVQKSRQELGHYTLLPPFLSLGFCLTGIYIFHGHAGLGSIPHMSP